jgi:flavin-dependent dehydrogenase
MDVPSQAEVFVVGGGPAGLAAAIAACRAGLQVVVADAAQPPIDKACGEGIMPDGRAALQKLGVVLDETDGAPFSGICFVRGRMSVAARFPQGIGMGVRRTTLHNILARRAADAGVTLLWNARVNGLTSDGVLLNGIPIRSRWIIGADGHNSRVRRWAGLRAEEHQAPRFGFRLHFPVAPWSEFVEVYWSAGAQVTVTPVGPGEVCVAIVTRDPQFRFAAAFSAIPELAERLGGTVPSTREQGSVSASRRLPCVFRGRTALIGEASGSVDALTGEGLSIAFQQATVLAQTIISGDLRQYEMAHRRIMQLPRAMGRIMLAMDRHRSLQERALRALSARPKVFSQLLAMHTGAVSMREFGAGTALELGWGLLAS